RHDVERSRGPTKVWVRRRNQCALTAYARCRLDRERGETFNEESAALTPSTNRERGVWGVNGRRESCGRPRARPYPSRERSRCPGFPWRRRCIRAIVPGKRDVA